MSVIPRHAPSPAHAGPQRHTPVTLDDLRAMEEALYQPTGGRFTTPQRVFFECLLSEPNLDVTIAARQAGVKPSTAARWVTQPSVQQALNHLLTRRMKRLGIDKDTLLAKIVDLLEMSMGVKSITKTAYDPKLGGFIEQEVIETDLAAAARFTDQLGKHLQLFTPEGTQGVSVSVSLNLAGDNPTATATVIPNALAAEDTDDDQPRAPSSATINLNLSGDEPDTDTDDGDWDFLE